ncbi:hypothetical protein CASFOL_029053 [Castilleja foliolosa]|uniref:Uncharacterized protein n=1 Tax=Castilleja foliolosa TaxID=1961234 RepID=A0ABD3CCT7_9LAMI
MASYNFGHLILFLFTLIALFLSHECYANEINMRGRKEMLSTNNIVTSKINVNLCAHQKHCDEKTDFCWCCVIYNRCWFTEEICIIKCT